MQSVIHWWKFIGDRRRIARLPLPTTWPSVAHVLAPTMRYSNTFINQLRTIDTVSERVGYLDPRPICALLRTIVLEHAQGRIAVDIQQIDAVDASKSSGYPSLQALGASLREPTACAPADQRFIRFADNDDWHRNAAFWRTSPTAPKTMHRTAWDDRLYLTGYSNGSHHLAALQRQAKTQGRSFVLWGQCVDVTINPDAVASLNQTPVYLVDYAVAAHLRDHWQALRGWFACPLRHHAIASLIAPDTAQPAPPYLLGLDPTTAAGAAVMAACTTRPPDQCLAIGAYLAQCQAQQQRFPFALV